ncbi:MAG: hypothetical protein RIB58_10390 [Phycisphaerales bacterium]
MRATLPRILAIVLALATGAAAFGQADLPPELPTRASLSPSEEQAVARWALDNWSQVSAEDPVRAREARRRLVAPLLSQDTSASFRVAVDQALAGEFATALAGDDVFRGVNAALLMGWLATDRSVRALTNLVDDDQVALRFAAISGLSNAFRASGFAPVAFQAQVGNQAVDRLAELLASAEDRSLLDGAAKALSDAMAVPESSIAGFGARSGEALTNAVGRRLNTMPIDDQLSMRMAPLIRAMADIRTSITQRRGNVSAGWQTAVMEMYGRAGALGFRLVRAEQAGRLGDEPGAARRSVRTALQVASTIPTLLRLNQATQNRLGQLMLADGLDRAADDDGDAYQRSATSLFQLLQNEFGLPRDRFNIDR